MSPLGEFIIITISIISAVFALFFYRKATNPKFKRDNLILLILSIANTIFNIIVEAMLMMNINIHFNIYGVPEAIALLTILTSVLPCIAFGKMLNITTTLKGQNTKFKINFLKSFDTVQFFTFLTTNLLGAIIVVLFVSEIATHKVSHTVVFGQLMLMLFHRYGMFFLIVSDLFPLCWNINVICMLVTVVYSVKILINSKLIDKANRNLTKEEDKVEFVKRLADNSDINVYELQRLTNVKITSQFIKDWEDYREKALARKAVKFQRKEGQ